MSGFCHARHAYLFFFTDFVDSSVFKLSRIPSCPDINHLPYIYTDLCSCINYTKDAIRECSLYTPGKGPT